MSNDGRTYTVYEVAELTGLTPFQVYRRIHRGDLPAVPGKRWREGYRVDALDLKVFIAAGCPLSAVRKNPDVMRVPEVMKVTGLSDDLVRQLCQEGKLRYERGSSLRGQYRISRESVQEYMAGRPAVFSSAIQAEISE